MSARQTPTRESSPDSRRGSSVDADDLAPYPAPPRRGRALRWVAGLVALALAGAAGWWAAGHPGLDRGTSAATPAAPLATARVERQDLKGQTKVSGTLGYAGSATVQSPLSGRITWLPMAGAVVRRGGTLLAVDNQPVRLFYGAKPPWRDLSLGVDDGPDVKELEQNLAALGYDPGRAMTVDEHFTAATAAAVKRWQKARGLDRTGSFTTAMPAVFLPWATRVEELTATLGGRAAPGGPVFDVTSDVHQVSVDLDVSQQSYVEAGDKVDVVLPDGRRTTGRVGDVGRVAETQGDPPNQRTTITVTIALDHPDAGGRLDQAPVDVYVTTQTRRGVLAVPVTALLALNEGGYAVEVVGAGGQHRLVAVRLGVFSNGMVEVSGGGLRAGMRVVTSQ